MRIKASLLRNNDRVRMIDGLVTVTNFKMVMAEEVVTFTATKEDGSSSPRWVGMDVYLDKVVS